MVGWIVRAYRILANGPAWKIHRRLSTADAGKVPKKRNGRRVLSALQMKDRELGESCINRRGGRRPL